MVAGGIAVNLYGIERATADVDIVLELEKENSLKFIRVAEKLGLRPEIPVKLGDFIDPEKRRSWRTDKGMLVFSLYDPKNPFFLIDIFTEVPFDFDAVYKKRRKIKFESIFIPIVPIKELIAMKEKSMFFTSKRLWMDGWMGNRETDNLKEMPLLYYRTKRLRPTVESPQN